MRGLRFILIVVKWPNSKNIMFVEVPVHQECIDTVKRGGQDQHAKRETHEDTPTPQAMKVVLVLCKAVTEADSGSSRHAVTHE